MQIYLNEPRAWPTASGAMQVFPAGWSGEAPGDAAQAWIDEGVAEPVGPAPAVAASLTPEQTGILAAAADAMAAQRRALEGTGAAAGDDDDTIDLETLKKAELVDIAAGFGLETTGQTKAQLIAAIVTATQQGEDDEGQAEGEA